MVFSRDATFGNADDVTLSYVKGGSLVMADAFDAPIYCRYIRYDVTSLYSTGRNNGAMEFMFYKRATVGTLLIVR